jgi:hypothetical protein
MQSRTALFGTVAFTAVAIAVSPRAALSPGPLTEAHAEIEGDCLACHTPLRGTPAAKCISCHPLDSVGIQRRSLVQPASRRPALAGMHKSFAKVDCGECHTDHEGSDPAQATKAFSHDALSLKLRQRCVGCHEGERPADDLHRQAEDDCAACHTTRAWTPASFKHDEYFVLDRDHQTRCVTCHTQPGRFKDYTCYGCHEHTPAGMEEKHREERVTNLRDCVRCHRSAARHEGEEGGREEGSSRRPAPTVPG